MSSSLIPPTPSAADYADSGDRALIPEAADPIALLQHPCGHAEPVAQAVQLVELPGLESRCGHGMHCAVPRLAA